MTQQKNLSAPSTRSPFRSPVRITRAAEMRALDERAEREFGLTSELLMENAGLQVVECLIERFPDAGLTSEVLVFAGRGNNGGDSYVVARRLLTLGRRVRVFHLHPKDRMQGAVRRNFEILERLGGKPMLLERAEDLRSFFSSGGQWVAVDGLIGTGLTGAVGDLMGEVIDLINLHCNRIVSIDVPSGIEADTGAILGAAIRAHLTVALGFPKLCHFLPPGAEYRGELIGADISFPQGFRREGDLFLVHRGEMAKLLQRRDRYGHKNSFGSVLLVGGSPGKLGALSMAARACLKMGTGLVTVATWDDGLDALQMRLSEEVMALPIRLKGESLEVYQREIAGFSSVVVGPGLGVRSESKPLLEGVLTYYPGPLVLDADALNVLAEHPELQDRLRGRKTPAVLTPHPGEMARLLGRPKADVVNSPVECALEASERLGATVVLKGGASFVASSDRRVYLNHHPNDGMATAGSGDVLAGMIGGLLGQGMGSAESALLGVILHSLSGDLAAEREGHRSMTARDLVDSIGGAFRELEAGAGYTSELGVGRIRIR